MIHELMPYTRKGKAGNKLVRHKDGTIYEGYRTMEHIGVLFHFKLDPEDIVAYAMIEKRNEIPWDTHLGRIKVRRKDWTNLLQLLRRAEPEAVEDVIRTGVERGWHNAVLLVEGKERRNQQ